MTTRVDFIQEGAFHLCEIDALALCQELLGPRVLLNASYMPYEYTITIFKDQKILRPENTYEPSI